MTSFIQKYASPLGQMTMAGDGVYLTGLWLDGQKYFGSTITEPVQEKNLPVFEETARWLDLYFGGKDPGFTPPLRFTGSEFRKAVFEVLLTIPYGSTVTYLQVA